MSNFPSQSHNLSQGSAINQEGGITAFDSKHIQHRLNFPQLQKAFAENFPNEVYVMHRLNLISDQQSVLNNLIINPLTSRSKLSQLNSKDFAIRSWAMGVLACEFGKTLLENSQISEKEFKALVRTSLLSGPAIVILDHLTAVSPAVFNTERRIPVIAHLLNQEEDDSLVQNLSAVCRIYLNLIPKQFELKDNKLSLNQFSILAQLIPFFDSMINIALEKENYQVWVNAPEKSMPKEKTLSALRHLELEPIYYWDSKINQLCRVTDISHQGEKVFSYSELRYQIWEQTAIRLFAGDGGVEQVGYCQQQAINFANCALQQYSI